MTATKPIRQIICEAIAQITLNLEDCIQTEGGQVLRAFLPLIQEAANAQIKEKRDVVTNKLTCDIIDLLEYKRRMDSKNIVKNYVSDLSAKFVDNIKYAGISQETATKVQEIFEEFIANEIPDINVIGLVGELREQAHPRPLTTKSLYRGFDVDGDPENFLKEN